MTQLAMTFDQIRQSRTPIMPTARKTLLILEALQRGERLTVATALQGYGVYACSQECTRLRKLGWPIEATWREVSPGVRVKEYRLLTTPDC